MGDGDMNVGPSQRPDSTMTVVVDAGAAAKAATETATLESVKDKLIGLMSSELTPQQLLIASQQEKARLEATFPDLPNLDHPPEMEGGKQEAAAANAGKAYELYKAVNGIIAELQKAIAGQTAPSGLASKEGDVKADVEVRTTGAGTTGPAGPVVNKFLTGSQYMALNEAIALLARALNEMNVKEAQASRDMRQVELTNLADQVKTIVQEGEMKAELMRKKAVIALAFGAVSALGHGAAMKFGPSGADSGARFQAHTSAFSGAMNSLKETTSGFMEASYQSDLAAFEAAKGLQRDLQENMRAVRQKSQDIIAGNRDMMARGFDNLNEKTGAMRRAMGVGRG